MREMANGICDMVFPNCDGQEPDCSLLHLTLAIPIFGSGQSLNFRGQC